MKKNIFKVGIVAAALSLGLTSCNEFLNAPTIDNYNTSNFYLNDEQCEQGVNYLYNSPWFDIIRGAMSLEVMAGNMYMGETGDYAPYFTFSVDGSNTNLKDYSYSLWSVNAHANTVINNIMNSNGPTVEKKKKCIAEALTWKAFAYFLLVRSFGDVPIVHDNAQLLNEKDANGDPVFTKIEKVQKEDVYDYIILTLEKAKDLLFENDNDIKSGRVSYAAVEGLLAKVYLTKAGVTGSLNSADLQKAADLSEDVILHSGRDLMPNFEDAFRLQNNISEESLLAWRWTSKGTQWTRQNALQADLSMNGFDEWGTWGQWNGITTDLQECFGVTALMDPTTRIDVDKRRHGTYMLAGDHYTYFWQDKEAPSTGLTGFNLLDFLYGAGYREGGALGGPGVACYGGGAWCVKHLHGNNYDHKVGCGEELGGQMTSSLATHVLRLADVYLVNAEANLLLNNKPLALERFNKVHTRAGLTEATDLTFDELLKERRKEFACETGDYWFDLVRLSYYDEAKAKALLKAQRRYPYYGLDNTWKAYYNEGNYGPWNVDPAQTGYDETKETPDIKSFYLPFPSEDVVFNGNMALEIKGIHEEVRTKYNYDHIKF